MREYYEDGKFRAGGGTTTLGIIGTVGAAVALSNANNGCGGGSGLFGGLLGGGNNKCMWSDREVSLLRQIDAVAAQQAITANLIPYQIREATCDMVHAVKYVPSNEIVYHSRGNAGCYSNSYSNGCGTAIPYGC